METLRQERDETTHEDIINPEIPDSPAAKLALLTLCVNAMQHGRRVEGVTPHHIGQEGAVMLHRLRTPDRVESEL